MRARELSHMGGGGPDISGHLLLCWVHPQRTGSGGEQLGLELLYSYGMIASPEAA